MVSTRRGETVKRRWITLILTVLLLCQLSAAPAGAAEIVYYTAVNDSVLDLSDATMPLWSGGYLYVPSTVFEKLGLGHSNNKMKGVVLLFEGQDRSKYLLFDVNAGTVTDRQGNGYYPQAIRRNGVVFLPVALIKDFFGLGYSNLRVDRGYLVRITNAGAVLSDARFLDAAPSTLEFKYKEYEKSKTTAAEVSVSPTETPEPAAGGKSVYLCIQVEDTAVAGELLDNLSRYSSQATFYFPPELMEENGDLLRRMVATGQAVGILADPSRTDLSVTEQVERCNDLFYRATCGKTRLVRLENSTDQALAEAAEGGCRVLTPTLDRGAYGLRSASAATTLLSRITARRGEVSVWLGSDVNAAGMRALLAAARNADDRCLALTETA